MSGRKSNYCHIAHLDEKGIEQKYVIFEDDG